MEQPDTFTTQPVVIEGRSIIILYGSETGNAEEIAGELGQMTRQLHFRTTVDVMDSFKLSDLLRASLVIFVTSTTGQGEMPKNTLKFWKNLLHKRLNNTNCLGSVKFTIFGLGDSSYLKFNWAARKLQVRLLQLGATEFLEAGEGDERHDNGIDSIYLPWSEKLKATLLSDYPLPPNIEPIPDNVHLPPKYSLELASEISSGTPPSNPPPTDNTTTPRRPPDDRLNLPNGIQATLLQNNRVTPPDHWQDVRYLHFQLPLSSFPQDLEKAQLTFVIHPKNYPEDVDELISMMNWTPIADIPLNTSSLPPKIHPFLNPSRRPTTTLRDLLTHNLDITAVPKRSFIRELPFFTQNEMEQDRLRELIAHGNEQDFYDYTSRPARTILEVLRDFPGVQIPFERIIDFFPLIRGREFSVCNGGPDRLSSGSVNISILVALLQYQTIIRKPRIGLCSHYLDHLPPGTSLTVQLKPASGPRLTTPEQALRPLITVGTGTGIAPLRALIMERQSHSPDVGTTLLFFGARNRSADYYFSEEWSSYTNLKIFPAFSRDPDEPNEADAVTNPLPVGDTEHPQLPEYDAGKKYVQHLIRRHSQEVSEILKQNPIICVSGSAGRMPVSVRNAFLDVLVMTGMVDDKEKAEEWFDNARNLTFWQETW
ncbi:hypothetical protein QBC35DRAFT_248570 [Podospora australis]|uniref:NADPH-dependent diflavin oxidoreductase 1 n=1 Tax=Podospora australis TaxID=1536484 RepID=A0AAN6WS03_9PEZI|nr:hypothetical protein QBC35DRAFT_248570 [Podospora australis]